MYDDVKYFVTKICKCIKEKTLNTLPQAPLKTITSSSPMELIGSDFLHLDTYTGSFQYLLVITDHFTRVYQVYPTRNKEAKTAATKLFNDYILRFGTPGKILHDQGREFENKLFTHLSKLCNIKRLCTTPYHPHCNGQVERMNRSIIEMLKTLEETEKKSWKEHLQKLVYAYNCTKHSTTGYTPYFLLFGRKPRLPIDLILEPTNKATQQTYSKFVDDWRNQMNQVYKIASTSSSCRKRKDIARHDSKGPLTAVLEKGDRVLIRNLSKRGGTGKIRSFWEDKMHVIIENLNSENITYKVQPENDLNGKIHTLHRNMLLSCDNLLDNYDWSIIDENHISNHKSKEYIKSKLSDTNTQIKDRIKNVTHNRSRGNKRKEVAYSDAETENSTENEALEFTPKELLCLDQGRIKRELERDSRNEGSGQQENVDFTIGQTAELDHKPNIIPKRGRTKKIIQVEDGSDYWEREKLQTLEKVQENDIVQNNVQPTEETRVKKLIYIEDPERIQVMGREREKQQRLPELKSQKRVKNLIYIQDPESMQHIDLRRSQGQQMNQPNTGKRKVRGPNNIKRHQPKKEYLLRSKHNTKTATVSEISHSGERVQQAMNEERLLFDQNKNPSVFAKPNDPNLTANGGYDHQADNEYGGNGYDHAGSQSGRYGYDNQADNEYDGNGYD